jgi:hypothetical protein
MASVASAHIESKTILVETETGVSECNETEMTDSGEECGAAVYGPDGFSGTIVFATDEIGTSVTLVDYICTHTPGGGPFESYGGSYTLKISEGGTVLDTAAYTVTDNVDCTGSSNAVTDGFASGATFTVPTDGTVEYSVAIAGITPGTSAESAFSAFNSIFNRAIGEEAGHANSPSVAPPTTFIIPEAPLAILVVVTGGLAAAWFVSRRMRSEASELPSAAA